MANTKTSKSASTKKATTKKTKDVEEKVNVIESAVEEPVEEVQTDAAEELNIQGSESDVNNDVPADFDASLAAVDGSIGDLKTEDSSLETAISGLVTEDSSLEIAIGKLVTEDTSLESAVNVEETEAEVKQSDEIVEDTGGIDLTKEDDVPVHVSAEEVKDFVFDKFSESSARQDEIVVPAPPVVVREKEVHVAKPLFPPSKYTQKTIVKKYH